MAAHSARLLLLAAGAAAGRGGPGNLAYTCTAGSPEAGLPFCSRALGFEARAADLAGRLNITEHVNLFFSYPGTPWVERYNVKGWSLDHTCIHGLNKLSKVTVFPHAIAQGASWDADLVRRVSNATAVEARITSAQNYKRGNGQNQGGALSCDGGPLANSAHDPRWGRISETYGEDPFHIQTIGVAAMQGLQNPQPVPGGRPDDRFYATRQVTRHYIAYHGGSAQTVNGTRHDAKFNASKRSLADSYFPTYGAFQRMDKGAADGIMCASTELNGVPSCANPLLMTTMLRDAWKSDAIIQTDCCDSLQTVSAFGYEGLNKSAALALAVNDGLGVYFGYWVTPFRQWMYENLGNGTIKEETVRAAGQRVLLSFMRLGFFDEHAGDFPFANASIPWELLDGPQHRALSREAAAKSTVLLKNDGILPLSPATAARVYATAAVIGPFAKCGAGDRKNWKNGVDCYLHSYNGEPSNFTSIYDGVASILRPLGVSTVDYQVGSNTTCGWTCNVVAAKPAQRDCWKTPGTPGAAALAAAAASAAAADVTVLAVGLGESVEGEGCDRFGMRLPPVQQALLDAVAQAAKKLIVVVVSAGGVEIDEGVANAVVWAPYGGQEAGSGLADVLSGRVNPSARLPVTFYTQAWYDGMTNNLTTSILNLDLDVGLGRTHRYITDTASNVKHFMGYGLSYTTFEYSGLQVAKTNTGLSISVTVRNTGGQAGAEVVQAYISGAPGMGPSDPVQNLIGFRKVATGAGASVAVAIDVAAEHLETAQADGTRRVVPGAYTVWVGGHDPRDKDGEAVSGPSLSAAVHL